MFFSTPLSLTISWVFFLFLIRKTKNVIWFSVIKINTSTNFMLLCSKRTQDICEIVRSLDRKLTRNRLKMRNFYLFYFIFLRKTSIFKKKSEKRYLIFCHKDINTYKFNALVIKKDFSNVSESCEFRFENSLNFWNTDVFYPKEVLSSRAVQNCSISTSVALYVNL